MPDMEMPRSTLRAIICCQLVIAAVHMVMMPNKQVVKEKKRRGPMTRSKIVAGSWQQKEETVKMKMETEYRFPVRSRSDSMLLLQRR